MASIQSPSDQKLDKLAELINGAYGSILGTGKVGRTVRPLLLVVSHAELTSYLADTDVQKIEPKVHEDKDFTDAVNAFNKEVQTIIAAGGASYPNAGPLEAAISGLQKGLESVQAKYFKAESDAETNSSKNKPDKL